MSDISKHVSMGRIYAACQLVEKLPGSEAATEISVLLVDAMREIEALILTHESALAAAVQAEREAIKARLCERLASIREKENKSDRAGEHGAREWFGGMVDGVKSAIATVDARGPSPTIPAVGEWKTDQVGNWRFFVGDKCLASISKNVCRWFTFSPIGGGGEGGYVYEIEAAKRQAVAALVRQGWYAPRTAEESSGVET